MSQVQRQREGDPKTQKNERERQLASTVAGKIPSVPAPDALDELRHTVHGVAVVRHDAAHAALHVHQAAVGACEEQHTALARAVVSERNLRNSHASDTT